MARKDPMLRAGALRKDAARYLGGADARDPLASPIHADLKGLPPLYIQAGTSEILLDDSTRLAERAAADGVEVDLDIWPGMFHVWQAFSPFIPESRKAIQKLGEFFQARTMLGDG
jgi:acetyl esterase/lipase